MTDTLIPTVQPTFMHDYKFTYVVLLTILSMNVTGIELPTPSTVLSKLFLEGVARPYHANVSPYRCFRGCRTPIKAMACKANLYSLINSEQLYICKYTAIDCAIVTLTKDRGWIRD